MAAANAGRKAKPPILKLLENPTGRDSAGRDIAAPLNLHRATPVKPSVLSEDAEWLWDQVIEQLEVAGLLKPLDAASLEVACETFARWREAVRWRQEHGLLGKNSQGVVAASYVGIEERASKDFRAWAAEFGFTPASEKNLEGGTGGGSSGASGNPFAG